MTESTIATFGAAFGLSLAYNLVPGPVTVEALRRGARRGVPAVLAVRLGSLAGSLVWAAAGLTGAAVAVQHPYAHLALVVAGTALLLMLAVKSLRPARAGVSAGAGAGARRRDALAAALIALTSPLEAAFWLGVGAAIVGGATAAERSAEAGAFLAGFIAADLLFTVVFAGLIRWGRGVVGGRLAPAANLLCVATLIWFALGPFIRGF
jgi:L-lysine exporter family protein LysE/ArgO